MHKHYQTLATLRSQTIALTAGDLRVLFADDAAATVAYGRKTPSQAALVVINRSNQDREVTIPVAGYLPDGLVLNTLYGVQDTGPVPTPIATSALDELGSK